MHWLWVFLLSTLIYPQTLEVSVGEYEIQDGEWLSTIAEKYNMSWETLYHLNSESIGNDPNLIQVSDTLQIPISSSLNLPQNTVHYKIEVWVFLVLFCILIWVFYKKKPIKVNNMKGSSTPVEVNLKGGGYDYSSTSSTETSYEVPIDVPNVVDFSYDKVEGEIKSDKIKSKADSNLAKKLKKLKKKG